ncbi:HAD-IB family hydrolase [Corynebacterium pilosum]|uniref:Phosphoserine phosphatase n=1 Tax=Corynebacterium pilosum TaxID=35756 RepID=A0A376CM81_9CORY|nr:HAD-IB family hydrolase [Corynebacterium pilosum]STC69544.1 phosphoserine phosphatase [Corynebacterium pilosum]
MTSSDQFPPSAQEFLHGWFQSQGNVRRFLEDTAVPPIDDEAQREAGEAAATAAVEEHFGISLEQFNSGVDSVSGAFTSAGARHITVPDPDIPQDTEAAAFFDIDNTLIQGSSLVEFALGLARKRFFRMREIVPIVLKQLRFRLSGSEHAGDMRRGREQALEFVRGKKVADLRELCEEIVDRSMVHKSYAGTLDLAAMHLAAGQQVWLVSATPVQIGQILAERFGFTGALGTVAEEENGKFTGRLVGDILHGPGKRHAVAALAAIQQLDLSKCTAYSDSINDIPMLSMVGTAVAINPDKKLKAESRKRGWIVRDYRSVRRAIRTWSIPALATAAASVWGWKNFRRV